MPKQVVYEDATQTLTNKTINAANNTITGISGGGWTTALDLDFTAQSNQNLFPDGNYTIDGLIWKKENSGQEHTGMAITNGTGLVISPGKTGGLVAEYGSMSQLGGGDSTRSSPLLWLSLSQLSISNLDWTTAFRIWVDVPSQTLSSAGDGLVWGIDNDVGTGFGSNSTWYSLFGSRMSSSTTQPQLGSWQYTGSPSASSGTVNMPSGVTSWTTSNQTTVVYFGSLVPFNGDYNPLISYGTAYSGGWTNQLIPWGTSSTAGNTGRGSMPSVGYANNFSSPGTIGSTLGLVIAGTGNATIATASITLGRIRVDYRL